MAYSHLVAEMTTETWRFINAYTNEVFGDTDERMATLTERASAAGLPAIAVSPDVGRLLQILVSSTPGKLAIEVGTLAGYSGTWIARGLADNGRLITIERDDHHADFAEAEFAAGGLSERVEVRRGAALDVLRELVDELGEGSVDFAFLDAHKPEYSEYFRLVRPLLAPGAILAADNVLGTGPGWIDSGYGTDEFNRIVAADPDFLATAFPMREGLLVAKRV